MGRKQAIRIQDYKIGAFGFFHSKISGIPRARIRFEKVGNIQLFFKVCNDCFTRNGGAILNNNHFKRFVIVQMDKAIQQFLYFIWPIVNRNNKRKIVLHAVKVRK